MAKKLEERVYDDVPIYVDPNLIVKYTKIRMDLK